MLAYVGKIIQCKAYFVVVLNVSRKLLNTILKMSNRMALSVWDIYDPRADSQQLRLTALPTFTRRSHHVSQAQKNTRIQNGEYDFYQIHVAFTLLQSPKKS